MLCWDMLAESALPDNWPRWERRLEWRGHGGGLERLMGIEPTWAARLRSPDQSLTNGNGFARDSRVTTRQPDHRRRHSAGGTPAHRLNARLNALLSE